eukprot:388323_1
MKWDENIHLAAKDGNMAVIQKGHVATITGIIVTQWLDAGLFVDKRDRLERTLLHHAAWSGRTAVIHKLIESHADVNARDKDQYTPLHYAARTNQVVHAFETWLISYYMQNNQFSFLEGCGVYTYQVFCRRKCKVHDGPGPLEE